MADQENLYPIYTVSFVAGDTYRRFVIVQDPDPDSPDPENPVMIPRNLTGWSAGAQVRKNYKKDASLIATFEISGSTTKGFSVVPLNESGEIHFHLSGGEAGESVKVQKLSAWDLELIDPDGDIETILGGPVDPFGEATR